MIGRSDAACAVVMYGGVGRNDWASNDRRPSSVAEFIGDLSCPVLGLFGEEDHIISIDDVQRFRAELERANKSYRIRVFRGAPHGWLNDTMPGRYRPEAAKMAWSELTTFLHSTLEAERGPDVAWEFASDISPDYDFTENRRQA